MSRTKNVDFAKRKRNSVVLWVPTTFPCGFALRKEYRTSETLILFEFWIVDAYFLFEFV